MISDDGVDVRQVGLRSDVNVRDKVIPRITRIRRRRCMLNACNPSVCLSHSYIVLKRLKISYFYFLSPSGK